MERAGGKIQDAEPEGSERAVRHVQRGGGGTDCRERGIFPVMGR